MQKYKRKSSIETMVLLAILTALVILLQFLGSFIRFGPFSISLVLLPIVVGAASCGIGAGAWLGLVFGAVVLISGDAAAFLTFHPAGTVITVLVKGIACGLASGLVYKCIEKFNLYVAVVAAAVVCPLVNTGVFLIGCCLFFLELVSEWGAALGYENVGAYMFLGLAGFNFLFELGTNIALSPIIVRLLNIRRKSSPENT